MGPSLDLSRLSLVSACLVSAYLIKLSWTPPNPVTKGTIIPSVKYSRKTLVRFWRIFMFFRYTDIASCIFHSILILFFPSPPKRICPNSDNLAQSLFTWSPYSALCLSTVIVFCSIRLLAFKELGKDFTFQVTAPKRLNTSGLYSVVQHPSYTGVVLSNAANSMFLYRIDGISACFLPGWIVRQAWWANWTLFFVTAVISAYGTRIRVRNEEEMLKKTFGREWEEWHAKTKRFIPGTNIQQANSALSSLLAVNLQNKALVTGRSQPIHPFATSPRPITLRSSPSKSTPPILVFPQANSPPAYSRAITYSPGILCQDHHPRTGLSETDNQGSSQRPMATYPSQHLYRTHPDDVHSIFLRAFHSPWSGIGRRLALAIRGFVSLYMTVTFLMVVVWHAKTEGGVSVVMFKFETISYLWQVAYSWVTFTWALMHLLSPCESGVQTHGFMDSVKIAFRYPLTDQWRRLFSLFYTGAISLPNVVALIYWTIVVPHDVVDVGDLFSNGDLESFCIINLYFISLVVALIEVFFLSSIKPPEPFFAHVLWLSAIAVAYYFWAFLGHIVTGNYIYFFMDPEKVGEENVVLGLIAFVALLNIFYGVAYGMSGARDAITGPLEILGSLQLPQ
ncbi:hypothetical protein V492_02396 [Pseudogymnoascus sp. VKM F-4246]|nr:hypothetical protein V492_02396 [Pseudogymnoascus sp. VKM F-4246]